MADAQTKTIVVTGASSGIGKATARLFRDKGWNVAATMRNPSAERDLVESAALKLIALDVQDPEAPRAAVAAALEAFGRIDVWVNNAGYGAFGPVEAGSRAQIERQFDVNVFGLIACVQAVAPHFRANRAGVLVNVSSVGGLMTLPSFAVYNASKFAVEGLSEGLWYELGAFGIKVKVVEPGAIATDFGGRSLDAWDTSAFPDYAAFMENVKRTRDKLRQERQPARARRRGRLSGGDRPERPHALSRRRRRAARRPAAPAARVAAANAPGQAGLQDLSEAA